MPQPRSRRKVRDYRRLPRQLALAYALAGSVWILLSDFIARRLALDPALLSSVQTYKGWLFVLVTGAVLYFLLRIYTAKSYELMSRLIDSETRFRQFFESVPDALFTARLPGFGITYATPSFGNMLDLPLSELQRRPDLWTQRLCARDEILRQMQAQLDDDGAFTVEARTQCRGGVRWLRIRGRVSSGGGVHHSVFGTMTDITEARLAEERAARRCLHDPLTDLLSPAAFALALDTLINSSHKQELLLSCCSIGIDDFEQLRTRHGSAVAEQLVIRLGRQLLETLRAYNVVGRGENVLVARAEDTFLFVMPERTIESMVELAQRLLDDLDVAVAADAGLPVVTRIGIASHPLPGEDAAAFVADAREALEDARGDAHTRVTLYNVLERQRLTEETARRAARE